MSLLLDVVILYCENRSKEITSVIDETDLISLYPF